MARRLAHELRQPYSQGRFYRENCKRARQLGPQQFQRCSRGDSDVDAEFANLNSIVTRFSDFSKMPAPEFSR